MFLILLFYNTQRNGYPFISPTTNTKVKMLHRPAQWGPLPELYCMLNKKNNHEQEHLSNVQPCSEYISSSANQAGLVAFRWVRLLIYKIRMKLFCCPHQSRQSLLEYWWPANGLLPQLPSLDTPTEQRKQGRESILLDLSWEYWSTIWPWDRQIVWLLLFSSLLPFHTYLLRAA